MSFCGLNYDLCTYKHNLKQSVGKGDYMLGTPKMDCKVCFSTDPYLRMDNGSGVSVCKTKPLVDVDSELKNITRQASSCPLKKYIPGDEYCQLNPYPNCASALPTEDTRISNPTCTMRCTGWNRWEWLCQNPQDKALVPFDYNINNRLVVKDNHRPCLPKPINQAAALPEFNDSDNMILYNPSTCMQKTHQMPSTTWRKCCAYTYN
jgi:hypothetical protein